MKGTKETLMNERYEPVAIVKEGDFYFNFGRTDRPPVGFVVHIDGDFAIVHRPSSNGMISPLVVNTVEELNLFRRKAEGGETTVFVPEGSRVYVLPNEIVDGLPNARVLPGLPNTAKVVRLIQAQRWSNG
jgi:hypothetical protein